MNALKVLHITPWYPNPDNEIEGIFIQRHIQALSDHCQNEILHIRFGDKKEQIHSKQIEGLQVRRATLKSSFKKWRMKEMAVSGFIRRYLESEKDNYDLVNFYIAYPNAIAIDKLQNRFPNLSFCITEQWSAYHHNFGLSEKSRGRRRIARIFQNEIPLITVSNALGEDIKRVSSMPDKSFIVIPNIVEQEFIFKEKEPNNLFTFCSINSWSSMKNPFVLIRAFAILIQEGFQCKLNLAGTGNMVEEMKELASKLGVSDRIEFHGRLSKTDVIDLLHQSNVYCQSSNYETFSAICAEALSTGTPVIATNIGGMKDFVNESNGALVGEMTPEAWYEKMKTVMENYQKFEFKEFAEEIQGRFSRKSVGLRFFNELKRITKIA